MLVNLALWRAIFLESDSLEFNVTHLSWNSPTFLESVCWKPFIGVWPSRNLTLLYQALLEYGSTNQTKKFNRRAHLRRNLCDDAID